MKRRHKKLLGLAAGFTGMLLVYLAAWQGGDPLGNWRYVLYGAGVLLLAGITMLGELIGRRGETEVGEDPAGQLEAALQERKESLQELARQLDRREQSLANKLVTFHEWMEFPEPVDLNEPAGDEQGEELGELVEKDHQVIELLESETERIFNAILAHEFVRDDVFQPQLVRDEVFELANRVARIYHPDPDAKWPLLETSAEQIMVATSRAALQLLVVIDQLPLNVKQMNIRSMYSYVSRAVQAYGVYKAARPYLGFASSAFYVGKFALGSNPAALGAWWILQRVGKRTTKAITNRFLNRQALGLLNSLVRAVGFEVAQIYGGDFRHRDANWIFAAELAEVVATLPPTTESLAQALQETGVLQLRSEYDRIYLYRMMAAGRSCQPAQYQAAALLGVQQREEITGRLQRFVDSCYSEVDLGQRTRWRDELGKRLQVAVEAQDGGFGDAQHQLGSAVTALANFLVHHKYADPADITARLSTSPLVRQLSEADREQLFSSFTPSPSFEAPVLEPGAAWTDLFVDSLVELQVNTTPRGPADAVVVAAGPHLGVSRDEIRQRLDHAYRDALQQVSSMDLPGSLPAAVASLVLDVLDGDEQAACFYPVVELSPEAGEPLSLQRNQAWLVGTAGRLFVLASFHRSGIVWQSESRVRLEKEGGWLKNHCCLTGGQLVVEPAGQPARIRLGGELLSGYERSFAPLAALNDQLRQNL